MPAFNKRHRETTYVGMKLKPLAGGFLFLFLFILSMGFIFNSKSYVGGFSVLAISLCCLAFSIYEFIHDDDYRVRTMKRGAKVDLNSKQAML